ncbi:urease accessory protein D isoform X2 [Zea mays]|uniref:Urease accessory protein D n=1 Tax=Zea mays TaxID=4577 RepID=A0A804PEY4_MAIZE|nr:urease accessory protein D isoform X2 [Zea mays]|eukprot:XP_020394028.1 urease accessory protein D isoform X2 [Zea mays]
MATPTPMGAVRVERVRGRSALTRCFARYPLKLIAPSRVGPSSCDAVWLYALTYGGGIVSGDTVSCTVSVGDGCTAAITTQASTKVYKAVGSKCSEQLLEARVGEDALLAVIPDPVTCFSTARYHQKQVFHVSVNSNLVLVDWFTSGRYESGERWDFSFYKSVNHIFLGDQPLFIDSTLLEQSSSYSIAERMREYNVVAMVVLLGPKLRDIQDKMQDEVRKLMSGQLRPPTAGGSLYTTRSQRPRRPPLVASCSPFGRTGTGMVARVAAVSTELAYIFLRHHLAALEPFLGAPPYAAS